MIYILEPGETQKSYSEAQALDLWKRIEISDNAIYWRPGMPEWRPAAEWFPPRTAAAATPVQTEIPSLETARLKAKDPAQLTTFLLLMLWISLGFSFASVIHDAISLATGNAGKNPESGLSIQDIAEIMLFLGALAVFFVTAIAFLRWIYRANSNARAFGAQDLKFTPGWSIGFYFIPIVCLWKPYQAMKEIWQASVDPRSWRSITVSTVVSNWWSVWLLHGFLFQVVIRMSWRAQTPRARVDAAVLELFSDLVDILLCFLAVRLVKSIHSYQSQWFQTADSAAPKMPQAQI